MLKKIWRGIKSWFRLCPGRHILLFVSLFLLVLFWLLRPQKAWMNAFIRYVTAPFKRGMSAFCGLFPFSVAELIWVFGILGAVFALVFTVVKLIRKKGRLKLLYRFFAGVLAAVVTVYTGYSLLWGVNYYGDSFSDKSGIAQNPVSADELFELGKRFAGLANAVSAMIPRENGYFAVPRQEIFEKSEGIYEGIKEEFPFLSASLCRPKPFFFSRIMSHLDFTGFYFPLTGESNLNIDSPAYMLPSTIAHEMAHQQGIAPEQEANFVAVMVCLRSEDPVFVYSGAMLGYVYLANALYKADRARWQELSSSLNSLARADFRSNSLYWQQFETPVSQTAQSTYNSFLQSYGQTLGVQSYGACVDLLVAYFTDREVLSETFGR